MRAKDLHKYKTLDITELSGSPWSNAEKVLGLDENDKVVMAEPDAVTYEDVDNAIDQAMAAETARTEATYMKTSSLDDYATKEYVDEAIGEIDLSDYSTTVEMNQAISGAIAAETARTEATYAKPSQIPSLDDYYTKEQVDEAIENVDVSDQLANYALTTAVTQDIQTAIATETARTETDYVKTSIFRPNINNSIANSLDVEPREIDGVDRLRYVRTIPQTGVAAAAYGPGFIKINNQHILGDPTKISDITLPTFNDVSTAVTNAIETETARTESTYAKKTDVPVLDDYYTKQEVDSEITGATQDMATKTWVGEQGYLTEHQDISGKLDVSTFNTYTGATATVLDGKADVSDIPDVSGFVTSGDVATQIGTAMSAETARTEDVYAKKSEIPSLDGYWTSGETKAYVDTEITGATADLPTKAWVTGDTTSRIDTAIASETARTENTYAKPSDIPSLEGYATEEYVNNSVTAATASTTGWVESQGYLTQHQDISGKLDKTDFNTYTGATETALAGKVDLTTYTAYTGSTATAIAAKQDTLVSGTNIKTINNQSLLGSGNIDIQGGGGGGNVVELTKAQYDALDPPAQDTTYIITDAETVDLNDYAPASGLTELSGTVATINSNYATKQNVTARASNSNYLPGWNAQGVITGSTAYYSKSQGINGTIYNVFSSSNTNHPSIFAPTSAGTAGQPLLSNGSGAPVWGGYKFAFVSQSTYDGLATPDANTIYFIIDPN